MDWNNIDLNSNYELSRDFLDGYAFDTLILELTCNYKAEDITPALVRKHVAESITMKVEDAIGIINDNALNIANSVKEYHKQD